MTRNALVLAILLAAPAASAQSETYGDQPSEQPPAATPAAQGEAEHEAPEDPSQHFNFTNFSWRGKDEWGGDFGDGKMVDPKTGATSREEEKMSPPFVYLLINFALLLLILAKYLAPAARKVARDRHDQIKSALDEAAKLRDEAAHKLADYEKRIKNVDAEVEKIVADIRASAEADKQRILANATAQAAQMKKDAELRIAAEIELARAQLAREVAIAATTATERLLRDKTTPADQQKLVGTFISSISGGAS